MPYRKRTERKRKPRRKYRRRRRKKYSMSRGIVSKTFRQCHRYSEQILLNPGTFLTAGVYSANGMFDPNISGIGHQPLLFDQMSALYNHYTVLSAKISVAFMTSGDTASTNSYIVALRTSSGTTVETNVDRLMESGEALWTYIGQGNGGNSLAVLKKRNNLNKFFGHRVMNEDDNAGSISTNPAEQAYFHVTAGSFADGIDVDPINCVVTIDYDAIWHEPKIAPTS